MSADTMEGLEALGSMAAAVDGANPSPEQQQASQQEQAATSEAEQGAQQWGMVMFTVGGFVQMLAPELKTIYTEDRCFAWGQQAHAVAKKHGWGTPDNMPELALIASTIGFAVPTFFLVREKINQARDGSGPASWMAKVGLWWRTRKARTAGAAMAEPPAAAPGAANGGKQ